MSVVEQQLTGYFTDGLGHGYLRLKVMGQNPTSLQAAVKVAVDEQNLRARFNLRSGLEPVIQHPIDLEHTPKKSKVGFSGLSLGYPGSQTKKSTMWFTSSAMKFILQNVAIRIMADILEDVVKNKPCRR